MFDIDDLERRGISFTPVSGRQPMLLSDPNALWLVEHGAVDVFLVGWNNGELVGARHPVLRVTGPGLLCGIDTRDVSEDWMLVGIVTPDSRAVGVARDELQDLLSDPAQCAELAALVDGWITNISRALQRGARPKSSVEIAPGERRDLQPDETLTPARGIVWLRHASGRSLFLGHAAYGAVSGDIPFPLAEPAWLACREAASVEALDTVTCHERGALWGALDAFGRFAMRGVIVNYEEAEAQERQRIATRVLVDDEVMENAIEHLAGVLNKDALRPHVGVDADPLLAACQAVGQAMGAEFRAPPESDSSRMGRDPLDAIVKASRLNRRRVVLREPWWVQDNGPLLAFMEDDGRPVALIPRGARKYELQDPTRREVRPVTPAVAAALQPFGYSFYRPFRQTAVGLWEVMRLGRFGSAGDIVMLIGMGLAGGLLGMVTPIATGMLFDTVIPGADKNQLFQLTMGLVAVAFATTLFQYTRSIAMLRLEGKMDSRVQSAVWDRLLTLPVPFFRDYTAGDLAMRANGINSIRQVLSGTTVTSILSSVFSLFNFALLFYYSWRLALVATVLVFVVLIVTTGTSILKLRYERHLAEAHGRLSGMVLQFLRGIAKLRVTGSEGRAFAVWAREFSHQRTLSFKAQNIGNILGTFNAVFPILGSMAIFIMMVFFTKHGTLTTGQFLAFNAAFGSFLGAMLGMTGALISIVRIIPLYERAKPILQTMPEIDEAKADPGELAGELEVNHLVFRYTEDGPTVINDVSLHIQPGQFVALVGASGSGKSTLLRLLLGFETPSSGTIYFDGKDLAGIDLVGVRRQMGVVLQNGQLLQGDIFTNIVGSSNATLDDAWEAARLCGLDKDIEELPMGMHTVVAEGGGGLSGGQRQRMLIARAIVQKPRILFFDEATSALDNATQAIVSESLGRLEATRIVIAHRLSTIVNADYIYVMDKGCLVQQGTYKELLEQPGLFADLAKRQIV